MRRFDQFATLLANVDLPRWFFAGSDCGDFEEGLPQGSPESSLAFCVLIQEAVQELHEALAGGGGARLPATASIASGERLPRRQPRRVQSL